MTTLLYKAPVDAIIEDINTKNGDTLPTPITAVNTYISKVTVVDASTGESKFELLPRNDNGDYTGNVELTYKRYLTSNLFKYPMNVQAIAGETYQTILNRVTKSLNIPDFIYQGDVTDVDECYDISDAVAKSIYSTDVTNNGILTIAFNANSPGYIGSISLNIDDVSNDLAYVIKNKALDVLVYPGKGSTGEKFNLNVVTAPLPLYGGTIEDSFLPETPLSTVGTVLTASNPDHKEIFSYYQYYIGRYYSSSVSGEELTALKSELMTLLEGATVTETDVPAKPESVNAVYHIVITPAATSTVWEGEFICQRLMYINNI